MRTTIVIDDKLMQEAMRATGLNTKRTVVAEGLRLLTQVKGQGNIRKLRGQIRWQVNLDELRASGG
jgi:Arc/MetJ family transcription regulator